MLHDVDNVQMTPLWPDRSWGTMITPGANQSLAQWMAKHAHDVQELIHARGALLFRGFPVDGTIAFQAVLNAATASEFYEIREASSPRSRISGNVFTSTNYPPEFRIYLHNEQSYVTSWPQYLFFYCKVPPAEGGRTPLADARGVFRNLSPSIVERFTEKGWLYRRNFPSRRAGISWRQALGVKTREAVDAYCRENYILAPEWSGDSLTLWFRRWAALQHPNTGDMVWFNHGLFFNRYTLEPSVKALMEGIDDDELAYNTYYGDATPIDYDTLEALDAAYQMEMATFTWERGDVLMIDNMRISHGREAFGGEREVVVAMKTRLSFDQFEGAKRYLVETP